MIFKDALFAVVGFGCFVTLNALGFQLWRSRDKLTAYTAYQRFLLATTPIVALIVVLGNSRGFDELQAPVGVFETIMRFKLIALPPALMFWFFVQERASKQSQPIPNQHNISDPVPDSEPITEKTK